MAEIAIAAVGLVISVLSGIYSTAAAEAGGYIQQQLIPIVKALQTYINQKNVELQDLIAAYNDKSGRLATTLLQSAGLGGRAEALNKEMESTMQDYKEQLHLLNEQIAEATNDLRLADEAQTVAGTSGTGNKYAREIADQLGKKYSNNSNSTKDSRKATINQNINGGMVQQEDTRRIINHAKIQ